MSFLGLLGGIVTSSATIFVALTWWGSSSVAAALVGWDGAVSPLSGVGRVVGVLGSLSGVVGVLRTIPQSHGRHAGELLTDVVEQGGGLVQQVLEVLG